MTTMCKTIALAMMRLLSDYRVLSLADLSAACDVPVEKIQELARMYATS